MAKVQGYCEQSSPFYLEEALTVSQLRLKGADQSVSALDGSGKMHRKHGL